MTDLAFTLRWFTGLIFLVSSLEKLDDWDATRKALQEYDLFAADRLGLWAALQVGWEALLSALLLTGAFHPLAPALAAFTFLGFAALLAYRLVRRGGNIACGCGGIFGDRPVSWWLVVRALALSGLAAIGAAGNTAWPADWLPALFIATGVAALIWLLTTVTEAYGAAVTIRDRIIARSR